MLVWWIKNSFLSQLLGSWEWNLQLAFLMELFLPPCHDTIFSEFHFSLIHFISTSLRPACIALCSESVCGLARAQALIHNCRAALPSCSPKWRPFSFEDSCYNQKGLKIATGFCVKLKAHLIVRKTSQLQKTTNVWYSSDDQNDVLKWGDDHTGKTGSHLPSLSQFLMETGKRNVRDKPCYITQSYPYLSR
jgi:hypothetical protein